MSSDLKEMLFANAKHIGVSENKGYLILGGPYDKEPYYFRVPIFGNPHIRSPMSRKQTGRRTTITSYEQGQNKHVGSRMYLIQSTGSREFHLGRQNARCIPPGYRTVCTMCDAKGVSSQGALLPKP